MDADHVVALSDAWQKGAATWAAGKRLAPAHDPVNLLAVNASTNRSKGDGDAATWLPPTKSYRCTYVARQVAVKGKYGVWVTSAERHAMTSVLRTCPSMLLPGPGSASTVAALPRAATSTAPHQHQHRSYPVAAQPRCAKTAPTPSQPTTRAHARATAASRCSTSRSSGDGRLRDPRLRRP